MSPRPSLQCAAQPFARSLLAGAALVLLPMLWPVAALFVLFAHDGKNAGGPATAHREKRVRLPDPEGSA